MSEMSARYAKSRAESIVHAFHPDKSRWAQGLAAWDLLYTDPRESCWKR